MFHSIDGALGFIRDKKIAMIDLKFCDLWGRWRHVTLPATRFGPELLEDGVGFDGSSLGLASVKSGDLVMVPELGTGFIEPFWEVPTLSFLGASLEADTREPIAHDPRTVASRAEASLKASGAGDRSLWERVGGEKTIHVDVRLVAATSRNLEDLVKEGRFREDLYYRLNVVPVYLPPLRERREDIPLLQEFFLRKYNRENAKAVQISPEVLNIFMNYDWPGNVRELENTIERLVVMCGGKTATKADLPINIRDHSFKTRFAAQLKDALPSTIGDIEKTRLIGAVTRTGWNQARASRILGITPRQIASLASENKSLAHPASVDSLPTSANQEDHVSMATFAARRLQPMIANTAHILGIELLAAAQGIEFLRPLASSPALEDAHALLRAACPSVDEDRTLAPDIERATALVSGGALSRVLRALPGLPRLWIPV